MLAEDVGAVVSHQRTPQHRLSWFYRWTMAFLGLFDPWLHLSCRSFIQLASEKYDRPLRLGERIRQALHRAMCRVCRIQERHMDRLHALSKEIDEPDDATIETDAPDSDVTLSAEARARIQRALEETGPLAGSSENDSQP